MNAICNLTDFIFPNNDKLIYNNVLHKFFRIKHVCSFFVNGKPIQKGNHRGFKRGNKIIVTDSAGSSLAEWQDAIRVQAQKIVSKFPNYDWQNSVVYLGIDFYRKHPGYHFTPSGKKSKRYTDIDNKPPDTDKLVRSVFDALSGTMYADDGQANLEHAGKFFGQPGVNIHVYFLQENTNE
ncbi:MAG: RusA family crossover junction endodeoxyribonuclease [Thermoguttaceae bacterium]|nr:RusA family crossover junction endodeoxyribonuclease [Thermoguttaceae bacterium]